MSGSNQLVGMLLLGIAIGQYIPSLPEPANAIQPYLGLILIVLAIVLFVKSG